MFSEFMEWVVKNNGKITVIPVLNNTTRILGIEIGDVKKSVVISEKEIDENPLHCAKAAVSLMKEFPE